MIMVDIDLCAPHAYIGPQDGDGASTRDADVAGTVVVGVGVGASRRLSAHVKGGRGRFN